MFYKLKKGYFIMKAVIMAGGEGTRLRPLTCDLPKPMVSFFDKPLVLYAVEHLKRHEIYDMTFTLQYKPEKVTEYFEDGSGIGVKISYSIEDSPLGTAGSVKKAVSGADGAFFVISGDALTDIDLKSAYDFHKKNKAMATLVLKKMDNPLEYGIVITDDDNSIVRFVEKPVWREVISDSVNTGIYILEPEALELIPENKPYDFSKNLFPDMLEKGLKLCGFLTQGYWCDIGNIESYIKAHEDVLKGSCRAEIPGRNINGIWAGNNSSISNSALVQSPAYLGEGCVIKDGAKIGMYSCISKNAEIGEFSNLKRAIVWQGTKILKNVKISSAVICANAFIGERSNIYEGAVVGRECVLDGGNSVRAKIWPAKWLENGAPVPENIVWGYGQKKSIFSLTGITGDFNGTLSAEKLTAAGCAYASALGKGSSVALGGDGSIAAGAVKSAFGAGLKLSGAKVYDMGETLLPVAHYYLKVSGINDGAYVKNLDGQKISIELMDRNTVLPSKTKRKKAQSAYEYFDFLRPSKDAVSKTYYINGADKLYIDGIAGVSGGFLQKPLIAVFANERYADRILISCLKNCGIDYLYMEENQGERPFWVKNNNADFGIILLQNAKYAEITGAGEVFGHEEKYRSLVYLYIIKSVKPEKLLFGANTGNAVKEMAVKSGLEAVECSIEDAWCKNNEEINRLLYDPIYFTIKLAEYLANKNITLSEFAKDIPVSHTAKKELDCEWKDVGKAIRMLYEENKGAVFTEGIKIIKKNGTSYILPMDDEPKISVRAEGLTEEYSKELCDFYIDELKRFIKS